MFHRLLCRQIVRHSHSKRRTTTAIAVAATAPILTTLCDDDTDDDPYAHLTDDDDEPTECTICKTNRQGPCRHDWRKFERCMKDNSKDEKDDGSGVGTEACDKYMLPWLECIQGYRNLYTVISNTVARAEYMEPYEDELRTSATTQTTSRIWNINLEQDVDFTDLYQYHSDTNAIAFHNDSYDWKKLIQTSQQTNFPTLNDYLEYTQMTIVPSNATTTPFQPNDIIRDQHPDIPLLEVRVRISPLEDNFDVCWARDQDGNMLGMDRFLPSPKKGDNDEPPPKDGVFRLYIEPGKTVYIQLTKITKVVRDTTGSSSETTDGDNAPQQQQVTLHVSKPIWIPEVLYQYEQQAQAETDANTN